MKTLIKLESDFRDWYDHAFYPGPDDGRTITWRRNSKGGMTRREMFTFLPTIGLKTVRHGFVKDIVPTIMESTKIEMGIEEEATIDLSTDVDAAIASNPALAVVEKQVKSLQREVYADLTRFVVYLDETAHQGEGKILLPGWDALAQYPDHYCSHYEVTLRDAGGSLSQRLLCVGKTVFNIQYHSPKDWRSNYGEVEIAVTSKGVLKQPPVPWHLTQQPIWAVDMVGQNNLAVDYNIAPGLDPIKKYMTATEIYAAVQEFMEWHYAEALT